ncbi:MAG TPA: DUF1990 domain-containing protein, partial [Actinoplanes sp.]|nr:DUF1990 domain-containing protein [Actinoplanes sp.]
MTDLTYPEVGATRYEPLPAGYRHLHHRLLLGRGVLDQAGAAVLTFAMHRATGARVYTAADRAAPGVQLRVGVGPGPLSVPCEVVWTIDEPRRAGFGYGTRPGHQARGEEAFIVEQDDQGDVWFRVTAFSVPARLPMR